MSRPSPTAFEWALLPSGWALVSFGRVLVPFGFGAPISVASVGLDILTREDDGLVSCKFED